MNAVEITGLRKKYGSIEALKNINFTVQQGSIYGLIGPNGAGKTTLIKALVGALQPTDGKISVLGLEPLKDKWKLRKLIGYMPQSSALYEDLSARDNILFFGKAQNTSDLSKKVEEILNFTELQNRANDPVRTFSGGMKKRASLACALIHNPDVLFLDEPTAAVDPHLKLRSWKLFRELSDKGVTLFISTHLMDEALLCDQVTILRNGEIIAVDTPGNLLEQGKTTINVVLNGEKKETVTKSDPASIASVLHSYGLNKNIQSLAIESDNLEKIMLSIINNKTEGK